MLPVSGLDAIFLFEETQKTQFVNLVSFPMFCFMKSSTTFAGPLSLCKCTHGNFGRLLVERGEKTWTYFIKYIIKQLYSYHTPFLQGRISKITETFHKTLIAMIIHAVIVSISLFS